jgi:hypothetical protein
MWDPFTILLFHFILSSLPLCGSNLLTLLPPPAPLLLTKSVSQENPLQILYHSTNQRRIEKLDKDKSKEIRKIKYRERRCPNFLYHGLERGHRSDPSGRVPSS